MRPTPILIVLSLLAGAGCVAQDLPEIAGRATLMNGTTYEGVIEVAEFGYLEGSGIGSDASMAHGYMGVTVDGQKVKVPFADIASAEAKWSPPGPEEGSKWRIEAITITRKDGTQVVGAPYWMLFATTTRVRQADGTIARAYALPGASPDFDPGNLLVKVEIGPPAATTTEPAGPTTEPGTEPAGATTEPAGTVTEPAGTTTAPTGPPTGPIGVEPVVTTPGPGTPTIGAPIQLTLTVVCPKCGEEITIVVDVSAKSGG